jgi:hypothetical protein
MKAVAIVLILGGLGVALAVLRAPGPTASSDVASAPVQPAAAAAAEPAETAPSAAAEPEAAAEPGPAPAASEPSTETATPEPTTREAAAYPWEEFEDVLGRELTSRERDALRDLRKEHGLRLAEAHARMQRGELERSAYDSWRAARAAQFRAEVEKALDCSAEQVAALLRVPLRSPAVP